MTKSMALSTRNDKKLSPTRGNMKLNPDTVARIESLITEAMCLPDIPNDYRKSIITHYFYGSILERDLSSKAKNLIDACPFDGDVISIYNEINGAGHPIRDALITNEIDQGIF